MACYVLENFVNCLVLSVLQLASAEYVSYTYQKPEFSPICINTTLPAHSEISCAVTCSQRECFGFRFDKELSTCNVCLRENFVNISMNRPFEFWVNGARDDVFDMAGCDVRTAHPQVNMLPGAVLHVVGTTEIQANLIINSNFLYRVEPRVTRNQTQITRIKDGVPLTIYLATQTYIPGRLNDYYFMFTWVSSVRIFVNRMYLNNVILSSTDEVPSINMTLFGCLAYTQKFY